MIKLKQWIRNLICDYIKNYEQRDDIKTEWKEAVVGFADADDKLFLKLKKAVSPTHAAPGDFLKHARTVICFFIPFADWVSESNVKGKYSSREWARAYVETNALIDDMNRHIKKELEKMNFQAALIPATHNFDEENLKSDWSHRHAAYIAGVGTFGINNMLITEKGCCGRVGSLITNLEMEATKRGNKENCLNKAGGSCSVCAERCVNNSLSVDFFDRHKCYSLLLENDDLYSEMGLTDACGKCCVALPCSFVNPNSD
ncbi:MULTISPECIES: epoxyqueuosine reductase [unclassified Halanaerobium]|uniref:epoxyqueuosine reductase n=1 Tax=unclassified Halanaerobium TaxID=2641197 RepID=UPI001F31865D|nr:MULTISPECIES: epoxyqueuosine reductase [unclassified Halanaerobium]